MKPINVEILMGHSVGISDSYYRPTEKELLQDYLRATDALTSSQENRLRNEVEARGKSIEANLKEKDREIKDLEAKVKILITSQTEMSRRLYEAGILKKD
jgi:tellurite resistance protein